jgi:hypothetical protein
LFLFCVSFSFLILFSPMVASIHAAQTLLLTRTPALPSIHWILDMSQCLKFRAYMSVEMHPHQQI